MRKRGNKNWNDSYRLQIGSKIWFNDLTRFGLKQNKSNTMSLPIIPNDYLSDFARGYFDGDGSVNLGRYWRKDRQTWKWEFTTRFTSGSKKYLEDFWGLLRKCISGGYLYEKNRGYELVFSRHDSVALFNLMYNNVSSDMYLKRKYDIFKKAFKVLNLGT